MSLGNEQRRKSNILKGFGIEESNDEIEKAKVRAHTRKTKTGKLSNVKEYQDKRTKKRENTIIERELKRRSVLYEGVRSLTKEDVNDIIHNSESKYFKGINHSRAKMVLEDLVEVKGDNEKFEKTAGGRLFLSMGNNERMQISMAVKRYKNINKK